MPSGIQGFDAGGNEIFSVTDRLARVLGIGTIGPGNGSFVHGGFATGQGWYSVIPLTLTLQNSFTPTVTISGTTLSWTFQPGFTSTCLLIYGVY